MKSTRSTFLALALCATTLPALAAQSAAYDRCMNSGAAAKGQMAAMLVCAQQELKRQDQRLNNNYQALMKLLDAQAAAHLRTGQRAWITFRDAEALSYLTGGMESGLSVELAKSDATQQRADELGKRVRDLNQH